MDAVFRLESQSLVLGAVNALRLKITSRMKVASPVKDMLKR